MAQAQLTFCHELFGPQVLISVNRRPNIRGRRPYEARAMLAEI